MSGYVVFFMYSGLHAPRSNRTIVGTVSLNILTPQFFSTLIFLSNFIHVLGHWPSMFILKFVGTFLYPENYERKLCHGLYMEKCSYSRSETYTTSVNTPTRKSGYFMLQRNTIEICCLMEYNIEKRNNNFIMICKTMPNHHLNPV